MKKDFVKICPHCGGIDITIPPTGSDQLMTRPDYCRNCNNRGTFPEVEWENMADFRKRVKKSSR
ncbi:MAG: hypothetical protein V1735_04610 [Nanoarchaeota archaeon]